MKTFTVPPEEPIISSTVGTDLKGLIGPFNEGDELKLVCVTVGGNYCLMIDSKDKKAQRWNRLLQDKIKSKVKTITSVRLRLSFKRIEHKTTPNSSNPNCCA